MQASIGPRTITTSSLSITASRSWSSFPSIAQSEDGRQWSERIARYEGNLALCIEPSQGVVIEHLLQSSATVYPVQQRNAKRYRERQDLQR